VFFHGGFVMKKKMDRREFLSNISKIGLGAFVLGSCSGAGKKDQISDKDKKNGDTKLVSDKKEPAYLGVVKGLDSRAITREAIALIGGISRFVSKGAKVIVKPNICTSWHTYEYAATTNPYVVAEIVKLCVEAGAASVKVMDFTLYGTQEEGHVKCGYKPLVEEAGGKMEIMSPAKYVKVSNPFGEIIKMPTVYKPILDADVVINVAIPKQHPVTRLTMGVKNIMGVVLKPGELHAVNIAQNIADLACFIKPALTVVDAVRVLWRSGTAGGSISDTKVTNTVIASHDVVAADAYGVKILSGVATASGYSDQYVDAIKNVTAKDIPYLKLTAEKGGWKYDIESLKASTKEEFFTT
jgi:uncharacterized protein (DUF362 family)